MQTELISGFWTKDSKLTRRNWYNFEKRWYIFKEKVGEVCQGPRAIAIKCLMILVLNVFVNLLQLRSRHHQETSCVTVS